jgi:hypothetical protein
LGQSEGIYKGGKTRLDRARVKELSDNGLGPAAIARELGMARSSVYRLLEEVTELPPEALPDKDPSSAMLNRSCHVRTQGLTDLCSAEVFRVVPQADIRDNFAPLGARIQKRTTGIRLALGE